VTHMSVGPCDAETLRLHQMTRPPDAQGCAGAHQSAADSKAGDTGFSEGKYSARADNHGRKAKTLLRGLQGGPHDPGSARCSRRSPRGLLPAARRIDGFLTRARLDEIP
jgi:hypothetical protein